MKRLLFAIGLTLLAFPALANSLGYQQSTSLSTSSAINLPSIPAGAQSVIIDVESAGVRFRDDGNDPTSSVGRPISSGQSLCYANDPHGIRIIGQTGSPTINVTYYAGTCR
jgi:hypothetical protein